MPESVKRGETLDRKWQHEILVLLESIRKDEISDLISTLKSIQSGPLNIENVDRGIKLLESINDELVRQSVKPEPPAAAKEASEYFRKIEKALKVPQKLSRKWRV
jgi:hypothetical protein